MTQINWTVRVRNPLWWGQVVASIVLPLIVGVGFAWEDMTSWQTLGSVLVKALENPVVVVSMLVSLWNTVTDPTTEGIGDSAEAMTYEVPKGKHLKTSNDGAAV